MKWKAGSLLADRFELLADPPVPDHGGDLPGRDLQTGARVRIELPPRACEWPDSVELEAFARDVQALALADVVPIVHVGPGLVRAEPPPMLAQRDLSVAEAAACALAACVVTARVHAIGGVGRLNFEPAQLRVYEDGRRWRIAWLVPAMGERAAVQAPPFRSEIDEDDLDALFTADHDVAARRRDPLALDLRALAHFFFSLAPEARGDSPKFVVLAAVARGIFGPVDHAAALARLFLPLVDDPRAHAASVLALPVVKQPLLRPCDWDRLIAGGELALIEGIFPGGRTVEGWVEVPLAMAYHQRASRACAAGDLVAALADVDAAVALHPHLSYLVTRAVVLDRLGRLAEAREAIDFAFTSVHLGGERRPPLHLIREHWEPPASERARAYATRGLIGLREGSLAAAESDLRCACALDLTAAHAHALGAVLYARDDLAGAAELETTSVDLAPDDPRYRWALVVTLHRLGRHDEARAHARRCVELDPELHARSAQLLGEA